MSEEKLSRPVTWYRTPLDPKVLTSLHQRSDARGLLQTLGFLAGLGLTSGTALYAAGRWPWPVVVGLVFLHGMVSAFYINGVHELGHGARDL